MKRLLRGALVVLALALAGMTAAPIAASDGDERARGIFLITGIFDCCDGDICVANGCWFVANCDDNGDCGLF